MDCSDASKRENDRHIRLWYSDIVRHASHCAELKNNQAFNPQSHHPDDSPAILPKCRAPSARFTLVFDRHADCHRGSIARQHYASNSTVPQAIYHCV
jgi:hypothetical protein